MHLDLLYHARGCGEVGQPGDYNGATSVRVSELPNRQADSKRKYHRAQIPLAWSKAHTLDGGCELPDPHVRLRRYLIVRNHRHQRDAHICVD